MTVSLIVAMATNRVIGRDGGLPWHISEDLKYFKKVTMGKPMIMGRKTWDSIGRPLPGRASIVVSRDPVFEADGATTVNTFSKALSVAETMADATGAGEVIVMGGAAVYERALPHAGRIYLTEVHREYDGDVFFPEFNEGAWQETSRDDHDGDPGFSWVVLERTGR